MIITHMSKLKQFFFGEQSLRQTLAKNSFWLTVSNVGGSLVKAAVVIYVARFLGASEYGLFSYAISVAAIFTAISDLGLNYLITLNMVRRDEGHKAYFSTLMSLRVGLLATIILLTIIIGPFITKFPQARLLIPFVALLIASDDLRALLNSTARAENRMDKEAFGNITTSVLILILCIAGLHYSRTSYMLTLMYLAGSALGTFSVFLIVKKNISAMLRSFQFNFGLVKGIFAEAIPFGLASAMWTLMVNTDTLMVGWFRSAAELGYYAAAQRPVSILAVVPAIMVTGSFTMMGRLAKEGASDRLKNLIEKLVAFSLMIVLPIAVGAIIIAPSIIHLLYGAEYAPAVLSFELLLLTLVITYPASIVNNFVLANRRQRVYIFAMIGGAVSNAVFDLLLIPPFGIAGSVVSTIIALVIIHGYMWREARKMLPFETIRFLPRVVAAVLAMGFATLALRLASANLFANVIISAAVYFGILIATREPLLWDMKRIFRLQ